MKRFLFVLLLSGCGVEPYEIMAEASVEEFEQKCLEVGGVYSQDGRTQVCAYPWKSQVPIIEGGIQ